MTAGLALLALFAVANYAPEALAALTGLSERAIDYVMQGGQTALLWAWLGANMPDLLARAACAIGAWEAMQRPACRLMFPLDRPPNTGDLNLCEAAIGLPVAWINAAAALFVALLAQEVQRAEAANR